MAGITLPPHDSLAEEAVLGCMLASESACKDGLAILRPDDFFIVKNKWVFESIQELTQRGQSADMVTINYELARRLHLDELGGPAYAMRLINSAPVYSSVRSYAQAVKSLSMDRQLLKVAESIAKSAYSDTVDTAAKLSTAYDALREITPSGDRTAHISLPANALLDEVELYADNPIGPDEVRGLSLGILHLDRLTGGLNTDDFTVLTSRPGVGKTALVMQVADTLAERGKRVLIYSLEMRARRVLRRIASRRAKVDWKNIDRGWATSDELARVMHQLSLISELPITINDDNHVTTAMITAEVDRLRPDIVIIDNLNIMLEPSITDRENDVKRIGRASRNLKILANETNIPVICICHMNRQNESRSDKRPTLSDLRDSGEIEQNADNVLGMYRDMKGEEQSSSIVEVWPLKLRDGDTSRPVKFEYNGVYYDFTPLESKEVRL